MQPDTVSTLFSFRSRPHGPPIGMHDSDREFIEELCHQTHDLPTMEAALCRMPKLADMPITPEYRFDGNFGSYKSENIYINMTQERGETRAERFEVQLTTLPHELRHGYQDSSGCFELYDDPRRRIEDMIICDRIAEADATAFSLAVMYELSLFKGNPRPLYLAAKVHPGSVMAYRQEIGRDENSHWNGRAANAAFCAYFRSDNRNRLQDYDIKLCNEFMRSVAHERMEDCPSQRRARSSRRVSDYMRPVSSMPFISRAGRLVEREAYRPERCDRVADHITRTTLHYIDKANRMLALD